jgi:hypothetical protein
MNRDNHESEDVFPPLSVLERLTACVLLLVVTSVGWMTLAGYQEWCRLPSVKVEVLAILSLLAMALILVSVVALWHTRS